MTTNLSTLSHTVIANTKPPSDAVRSVIDSLADGARREDSVVGRALGKLGTLIPPPFDIAVKGIGLIFELAQSVTNSRVACHELARRLAAIAPAVVAMSQVADKSLTETAIDEINRVVALCEKLIKKFAPSSASSASGTAEATRWERFKDWCKTTGAALTTSAKEFDSLHLRLDGVLKNYLFASQVQQLLLAQEQQSQSTQNSNSSYIPLAIQHARDTAEHGPTLNEIRAAMRDELEALLTHFASDIKRANEETAKQVTLTVIKEIQQLNQDLPEKLRHDINQLPGRVKTELEPLLKQMLDEIREEIQKEAAKNREPTHHNEATAKGDGAVAASGNNNNVASGKGSVVISGSTVNSNNSAISIGGGNVKHQSSNCTCCVVQ